jgi:hypothetical protein
MRRLFHLLLLVMVVSITATCVNASTDCERWFKEYRLQLAHNRQVQRLRRAKLYAKRKLAGYIPKPKPVIKPTPRMTPRQALHHFELACGALPEDETTDPVIAENTPPPFEHYVTDDRLDTTPAELDDVIPPGYIPPYGGNSYPDYPSGGYPVIYPPVGGGPPIGGGAYLPPGTGGGTTLPPGPPTTPDTPDVPEPSSIVLMLTGAAGAAGALRSRFKA